MTRRFPRAAGPVWICALLLAACGKTIAPLPSPIIAMVDEDGISLKEFKTAFLEGRTEGTVDENSESIKELKRNLLHQLIEQRLFLAEAARRKLQVGPEELRQAVDRIKADYAPGEFEAFLKSRQTTFEEWKERLRQELLSQKVINQAVPEKVEIADPEVQTYYKRHPKEFVHPEEVRARQIVVTNEEAARDIRAQLLQGADFAALAEARSLSPDKDQGGDLGFFSKGQMPEEFDIVFTLGIGKISPTVKTAYGFHIFKVEERHPARAMPPTEAAERIRGQLTQERREKMFTTWVAELKGKAHITVNYQILYQPLGLSASPKESQDG